MNDTDLAPPTADAVAPPAVHGASAQESAVLELLTFHMVGQVFAVDIMRVREIRGWTRPTPLPHAPPHLCGVVNLRGTVLPILDLAARIAGTPTEPSSRNVIIVVETADQVAGILVEAVNDILTVDPALLQQPPELPGEKSETFIEHLAVVDGEMIRTLDMRKLLKVREDIATLC